MEQGIAPDIWLLPPWITRKTTVRCQAMPRFWVERSGGSKGGQSLSSKLIETSSSERAGLVESNANFCGATSLSGVSSLIDSPWWDRNERALDNSISIFHAFTLSRPLASPSFFFFASPAPLFSRVISSPVINRAQRPSGFIGRRTPR